MQAMVKAFSPPVTSSGVEPPTPLPSVLVDDPEAHQLPALYQKWMMTSASSSPSTEIPSSSSFGRSWPKTDFVHWIPVLNRLDMIMSRMTSKYGLAPKKPNQPPHASGLPPSLAAMLPGGGATVVGGGANVTPQPLIMQTSQFTPQDKEILLATLRITLWLWENCTNRSLYSSYEHLTELLQSNDIDVLQATLAVLHRAAQRISSQKSLRNHLNPCLDGFLVLASEWGTKEHGVELAQLAHKESDLRAERFGPSFQFYRLAEKRQKASEAGGTEINDSPFTSALLPQGSAARALLIGGTMPAPSASTEATPSSSSALTFEVDESMAPSSSIMPSTPATPAAAQNITSLPLGTGGKEKRKGKWLPEGLVTIHLKAPYSQDTFSSLVSKFKVPEEHQYALFHRIRIAACFGDTELREKCLSIRLLAIAALCNFQPEEVMSAKLFMHEPDLVAKIAELLSPVHHQFGHVDLSIQTAAIHALDAIAHYRGRLSSVVLALNISANHGSLMYLLKSASNFLKEAASDLLATISGKSSPSLTSEFLDALLSFISHITGTNSGGNASISSGIIPLLVDVVSISAVNKHLTKCTSILDSMLFNFSSALVPYSAADGVEMMVRKIAWHVERRDASFDSSSSLRALLKLVMHLMQSYGTADRVRNLIDSTLPQSIAAIFGDWDAIFGANIYGLAVNIMSTFIHNEPNCLSILQEGGVTALFLKSVKPTMPISPEVISAIPNAFGAICLNQPGLDSFLAAHPQADSTSALAPESPLMTFIAFFTQPEHLATLQDNDVPHLVGNALDELMRHHPVLKPIVMSAIVCLIDQVNSVALTDTDTEGCHLADINVSAITPIVSPTSPDASMADVGGASRAADEEIIIDTMDMSQDSLDAAGGAAEQDGSFAYRSKRTLVLIDVVSRLLEGLFQNPNHCKDFIKLDGHRRLLSWFTIPCLPYDFIVTPSAYSLSYLFRGLIEANGATVVGAIVQEVKSILTSSPEAQEFLAGHVVVDLQTFQLPHQTFRCLIPLLGFIRVLGDVYSTHVMSHSKSVIAIIEMFSDPDLLPLLGAAVRACYWQDILLVSTVSADEKNGSAFSSSLHKYTPDAKLTKRQRNKKYVSFLLKEIPTLIMNITQGSVRILNARRVQDDRNRKIAVRVLRDIAYTFVECLTYPFAIQSSRSSGSSSDHAAAAATDQVMMQMRNGTPFQRNTFSLLLYSYIGTILVDEKSKGLSIAFARGFVEKGGLKNALDALDNLLIILTSVSLDENSSIEKVNNAAHIESTRTKSRLLETIKSILSIVSVFSNVKLAYDGQSGAAGTDVGDGFDVAQWVLRNRVVIAPQILKLWTSCDVSFLDAACVKSLVSIMGFLCKAEPPAPPMFSAESSGAGSLIWPHAFTTRPSGGGAVGEPGIVEVEQFGNLMASIFRELAPQMQANAGGAPAPPVVVNAESAQLLVEMGFSRTAAERALIRFGNDIESAAEYLLAHPFEADMPPALDTGAEVPAVASSSDTPYDVPLAQGARDVNPEPEANPAVDAMEDFRAASEPPQATLPMSLGTPMTEVEEEIVPKYVTLDSDALDSMKQDFASLKTQIVDSLIPSSYLLVDKAPRELKDLLTTVFKNDKQKLVGALTDALDGALTPNQMKLLALIAADSGFQQLLLAALVVKADYIAKMVKETPSLSVFLLVELMAIETHLATPPAAPSSTLSFPTPVAPNFSFDVKRQLIADLVAFLINPELMMVKEEGQKITEPATKSWDVVNAVLRILVVLTRQHTMAVEFETLGGVPALFNEKFIGRFAQQQPLTHMILRHVVERPDVLKNNFDAMIKKTLDSKPMEISTLIKSQQFAVVRNPDIFVASLLEHTRLKVPLSARQQLLELKEESRSTVSVDEKVSSSGSGLIVLESPSNSPLQTPGDDISSPAMATDSHGVISYLVQQLLALRPSKKTSLSLPERHVLRCSFLHALSELVMSYPTARKEFLAVSSKTRTRPSSTKNMPTPKNSLLNHLINDLVPVDVDPDQVKKAATSPILETSPAAFAVYESQLALNFLFNLVTGSSFCKEALEIVLDILMKGASSVKESSSNSATPIHSTTAESVPSYTKIIANVRILQDLLRNPSSPLSGQPSLRQDIANVILERNGIAFVTNMLSVVDIHHPQKTVVLQDIIKLLEVLTLLAAPLLASSSRRPSSLIASITGTSSAMADTDQVPGDSVMEVGESGEMNDGTQDDNAELSNIYRHSSLGIGHQSVSGRAGDHEDDEGLESDGSGDISDEFITDSEAEDDMDSDASIEGDDMEIMMPAPYHGGEPTDTEDSDLGSDLSGMDDTDSDLSDDDEMAEFIGLDNAESDDDDDSIGDESDTEESDIDASEIEEDDEDDEWEDVEVPPGGIVIGDDEDHAGHMDLEGEYYSDEEDNDRFLHEDDEEGEDEGGMDEEHRRHHHDLDDDDDDDEEEAAEDEMFRSPNHPMSVLDRMARLLARNGGVGGPDGVIDFEMNNGGFAIRVQEPRDNDGFRVLGRPFGGGGRPGQRELNENLAHPLLMSGNGQETPTNARQQLIGGQSLDEVMGREAMQFLEHLFSGHGDNVFIRGPGGARALGGPFPPGRHGNRFATMLAPGSTEGSGFPFASSTAGPLDDGNALPEPLASAQNAQKELQRFAEEEKRFASIHTFTVLDSANRWKTEARTFLGKSHLDKASQSATNLVLHSLLPEATDRDAELKAKAAAAKIDASRLKKDADETGMEADISADIGSESNASVNQMALHALDRMIADRQSSSSRPQQTASSLAEPEVPATERQFVDIGGEQVEITGSGIDSAFLEALPDYLRREVLREHMRSVRNAAANPDPIPQNIDREYLDALPFEIRQEIVNQETAAQRSLTSVPVETSAPVVEERSTAGIATSSSSGVAQTPRSVVPTTPAKTSTVKGAFELTHIFDKKSLFSIVRLFFIADPGLPKKSMVNLLLHTMTNNPKERSDIFSMFLTILEHGDSTLAEVESRLNPNVPALLASGSNDIKVSKRRKSKSGLSVPTLSTSSATNLVALICLETLIALNSADGALCKYFVQEPLSTLSHAAGPSSATKKDVKSAPKLPLLTILALLERREYLETALFMEHLMHLLSIILKNASRRGFSPVIPDRFIRVVANSFTKGVCTPKSFQSTLLVVKLMSMRPTNKDIMLLELRNAALTLADNLLEELSHVIDGLEKFSSSTLQAKLLWVLKTIDYISPVVDISSSKTPLLAPSATAVKITDEPVKADISSDVKAAKSPLMVTLNADFRTLWTRLGATLSSIKSDPSLMHVATVLLPLIESFMVVWKPIISHQLLTAPPSLTGPTPSSSLATPTDREFFFTFTEEHRKILNTMVRNNPSLMSGSFSVLIDNPKVLEFDNKRTYFTQQLRNKAKERNATSISFNVRRSNVFEDSFHQLHHRSAEELKYGRLNVHFYEEEGVDAGGVTREFFTVLSRQIFNPNYCLFKPSAADKVTYQPNRASGVNPDHLSYFKFVGRMIGKAIYDSRLLDCYFTRSFYKCMIGSQVDYKDMEAIDPEFHKSLEWMLQNDITDVLDLTFCCEIDDFGQKRIIDLIPNGAQIPVTQANKVEYVKLITEQRLVKAIKDQIDAFLTGFHDIIPKKLVQIFNEQELELLISGLPDIDIDDWKNNTEYQNYTATSPQILWFWRAIRSFTQEERAKVIQFATGTSKVPLEGFAALSGSNGTQKFQIHKEFSSTTRLPSAHTCFNQIDLPEYETYEALRENLLYAISECGTGFGFA